MIYWPEITFPPLNLWNVWKANGMNESPCKGECNYSPKLGFCECCGRTLQELEFWTSYSHEEKLDVIIKCKRRKENNELTE